VITLQQAGNYQVQQGGLGRRFQPALSLYPVESPTGGLPQAREFHRGTFTQAGYASITTGTSSVSKKDIHVPENDGIWELKQ